MNLRNIILALAGIAAATDTEAFAPLAANKAKSATKYLNNFRRTVKPSAADMHVVTYDYAAQTRLDAIISAHAAEGHPRWLFEVNPNPPFQFQQNMNGYFIGAELGMSNPFWGWHDTCAKLGQDCISHNFAFRFAQYNSCFDYKNCNTTDGSYDRFKSCMTDLNEVGSGSKCSYAWVYMGKMLRANITRMACAVIEQPGWKPPKGQLNSYWCYTDGTPPLNDQPYKAGKWGSDCNKVKSRLCV